MKITKILRNIWVLLIEAVKNILVPEGRDIERLMKIDQSAMRAMLPESPVHSKDIYVLFDYRNKVVRLLVKSIKYKNNQNLRRRIAQYFYEAMADIFSEIALFEGAEPLLVPMPMGKKEKAKKGFNQCEELVKEIRNISGKNFDIRFNALKKIRETERQTKLSREQRLKNVANSMQADQSQIKGRVVAVLDDVYTTGSTMLESRRALYGAGAKQVINFFIAR